MKENGNELLGQVVTLLVDRENVSEEKKESIRRQAALAAKKVGRKAGSTAVQRETIKALGDLKISELPPDMVLRGMAAIDEILNKKNKM